MRFNIIPCAMRPDLRSNRVHRPAASRLAASRAILAMGLLAAPAAAATVNWVSDTDGSWATAANWSSNPALPNVNDDVIISRPAADPLVSILSNFSAKTLLLDDRLLIMGGSLSLSGGMTVNGSLTLQTVPGTFSTLNMVGGAQTLGGTGQVVFNGSANDKIQGTDTLTIGPNITIRSGTRGGDITLEENQGTISSQTAGQTINVSGNNWINSGILEARNGGTLNLGGTIVTANLGTLTSNPGPNSGTIRLTGIANNANSTLNVTGGLTLAGGTIRGGTVAGAASLTVAAGQTGTLDGVTVNTDLVFPAGGSLTTINGTVINSSPTVTGATLIATGGLTVNGTLTLQTVPGTFSTLDMDGGVQTLGGTGQVVFNGSTNDRIFGADTLTIGPNITLRSGTRGGDISLEHNQGTISSQRPPARPSTSAAAPPQTPGPTPEPSKPKTAERSSSPAWPTSPPSTSAPVRSSSIPPPTPTPASSTSTAA